MTEGNFAWLANQRELSLNVGSWAACPP